MAIYLLIQAGDEFDDEFCHILVEGEDSSFDGLHPDEVVLEP